MSQPLSLLVSDSDGLRMDAGRLFHTRWLLTAKDQLLNIVLVCGTFIFVFDDEDLKPKI